MVRIAGIQEGTLAEELRLEIGSRIVRINGQSVRDSIDLQFLLADAELEVEALTPSGESITYEVERDPAEPFGVIPAPDAVRECANDCVFCFIYGNPPEARRSLFLRDDDFRLSFAYGNYVTLTNLGPRGLERLMEQRVSPLYVSVHATEPEVRLRLLKNERAGQILDQIRLLTSAGLELHTQVVLCPGWNDGPHLDRTMDDLWSAGPGVISLSVVPVGLTRYNAGRPVRLLSRQEARRALRQVDQRRRRARQERRAGWCYAADELFLIAGKPLPPADYYDDWPLIENGVGAVRRFLDDFQRGLPRVPQFRGRRILIVSGTSMAAFLEHLAPRLARRTCAEVEVVAVPNDYFGPTVTVAGLLPGRSILRRLGGASERDIVLLPAEALNADQLFIDDLPLKALRDRLRPATVAAGYELTEALRAL
ncbi:MAG: DUF512 domain-containing protein [Gemmatimonadetes bacterium]|nr:DUF512 domain-containing protein [Gemmatimonadota bacterium]